MTRAAGKALFSTKLGQFALRPQIDRFAEQLCEEFPDQCRNIYLGFYTIHDYFDPSDIARLGEKYLNGVLERIAAPNSEAVANFTYQWSANNRQAVEKMCYPFDLGDFFSEDEIRERGVLFFIHAVNLIRQGFAPTA
ncbi:jumonji domain-containing 3 [Neofusicoccum parvum]|nr:jumonji domain-containing 3 [Neofusicoccum parvum]